MESEYLADPREDVVNSNTVDDNSNGLPQNGEKEQKNAIDEEKKEELDEKIRKTSDSIYSLKHTPVLSIAHILQQKYIYLNGCLDKEQHPILICSFNRSLGSLDQDDFKSTVNYFKEISSVLWERCKFLVIIDRQHGKWNSVKSILSNLQVFDADEIFKILLLKPQGFLQRHFGNSDVKQIKELSKHELVFLDNPTMLEDYVELACLPDEFGGFDSFNVNEWVEYTTAVERFQQTCIKIRNRVKEFRTLFGSRVPLCSVTEIEQQAKQQRQMVTDIQEDIKCASEIAETLAPIVDKPLSHSRKGPSALERYNSAQLKAYTECLSKYHDEIEALWQKQANFHEQSKELCGFEESFGQISIKLMQITSILDGRTDIGDSLSSANELMYELDDFELKRKEPYNEMMKLKEKGMQMVAFFGEFAKESVVVRCNEIKHLLKDFEIKLEARKQLLQVSLDVFTCLDQIEKWCQVGVELLASQPVEAFNQEEAAKKCYEDIQNFMKNKSGISMNRIRKLKELCQKLGNPSIDERCENSFKRIQEVTEMLEKREASLKKVALKPKRPVQRVEAIVINKDYDLQKEKGSQSPKIPQTPIITTPTGGVTKESIEVVVTDDIEKYKRNKTFRKSLRLSFKRPVSSPAQLQLAEYEEDPEHRKKIRFIVAELCETEIIYVKDLKEIIEGYFAMFDNPSFNVPEQFRSQKAVIFGNIDEIYIFHSEIFLEDLKACKDAPYMAGHCFLDKKEEFQFYATYCKNKPKSELLRNELHKTTFLQAIQKQLGHPLNLDSYLLKPVQRITKYKLLLTEMLKYVSKKNPAYSDILEALVCMKRVLRNVNDVMHSSGLTGFPKNLDEQGKLLLQDSFTVWEGKKSTTLKQLTKLGAKHRQVFLFEKCLIFSKKEVENGRDLGTYQYKGHIWTADIGVTESVRGDANRFEVWSKIVVYTLQANNTDMKTNWLSEIRKILMSQFEGAKETLTQKLSSDIYKSDDVKQQLRQKLKFLDPSLRASTPVLNLNPSDIGDRPRMNTFGECSPKKEKLRACTSESNLLDDNRSRSTDSLWSDSEFEDDAENAVIEETTNLPDDDANKTTSEEIFEEEVSPRTQGEIQFCSVADYEAMEETELSLKYGDKVSLIKEGDDGWWYCKSLETNQEGWAPSGYLEINALDVTDGRSKSPPIEPVKPSKPSPKKRLETAV
ncbi:guanine nucleotide exchange factor DBS-like [Clytia hemisphaerica]|uniref:Guanine nucleotide exchange factor DBS n=1 Tax=Clytia hemisphaerica TaxID=252671 RepID=A0A7M5XKE8_9CNID|eukprot:TCONS_00045941-protein